MTHKFFKQMYGVYIRDGVRYSMSSLNQTPDPYQTDAAKMCIALQIKFELENMKNDIKMYYEGADPAVNNFYDYSLLSKITLIVRNISAVILGYHGAAEMGIASGSVPQAPITSAGTATTTLLSINLDATGTGPIIAANKNQAPVPMTPEPYVPIEIPNFPMPSFPQGLAPG